MCRFRRAPRLRLKRAACSIGAFIATLLFGSKASHAADAVIRIEYGDNAWACPSRESVRDEVRLLRPQEPVGLSFERTDTGYRVAVTAASQTRIHDDKNCAPLVKAALVSIALLLPESSKVFEPEPANEMPPRAPRQMPNDVAIPNVATPRRFFRIGFLPTTAYGLGALATLGTGLHLTLTGAGKAVFGAGIRGLLAEDRDLGMGTVRRSLAGGWVDACLPFAGQRVRASACLLVSLHGVFADASGLQAGSISPQARLGAGGGLLGEGPLMGGVLWHVRIDVDTAIYRESFVFNQVGADLTSPRVAAIVVAGLVVPINE